ncbi:hypothetical protein Daura_18175 [Dactylosporangium aurantiacum]|uniref:Uncharacterized protein n=1 Tax=Dactylosporangium aurantiacum TaxID=35754 RepID=A0A9Q9IQC6_9ACTN|nr:hypothetical protein [Dactylosporangium aurantiacum]MDG6105903.1 hypothetical protein [Dactylosporangium aurantiacum]UWZ57922.1 hypothetical protein Daura_18175 [Dactylosporangium aurantiacum]
MVLHGGADVAVLTDPTGAAVTFALPGRWRVELSSAGDGAAPQPHGHGRRREAARRAAESPADGGGDPVSPRRSR